MYDQCSVKVSAISSNYIFHICYAIQVSKILGQSKYVPTANNDTATTLFVR